MASQMTSQLSDPVRPSLQELLTSCGSPGHASFGFKVKDDIPIWYSHENHICDPFSFDLEIVYRNVSAQTKEKKTVFIILFFPWTGHMEFCLN